MESYLRLLYSYVQEEKVRTYLQTSEYHHAIENLEEDWEDFRGTLTAEQEEKLETLLNREQQTGHLESGAIFCSALALGISLGRL